MEETADVAELVRYLESNDLNIVAKFKQVVHENLYAAKDASLLNSLVEAFVVSKSENLLEVLAGVNDAHCQALATFCGLSKLNVHKFNQSFSDTVNSMCPTNDGIEDMEHFLLLCPSFDIQRRDLLAGVSELLRPFVQINTLPSNVLVQYLLYGNKERPDDYIFDKMNDLLRRGLQTEVSILFAAIIRKQPSWLYKVVGSQFFANYLKCLRGEHEVTFLMSGAVIVSMLLPCVPSLVAQYLGDILEIFIRMASVLVYKPASLPDILTLHLQIGVYILFHRLYAMYPNNFLSYTKSCFGSKGSDPVFRQVIQPMSQFVKLHPGLVLDTLKSETENEKWKTQQPHDIFAECQKISLDPLDAVKEATYTVLTQTAHDESGICQKTENIVSTAVNSSTIDTQSQVQTDLKSSTVESRSAQEQDGQERRVPILMSQELSLAWSPSFACGFNTPPSSRTMSPANSTQDVSSLNEFVQRPITPVADTDKDVRDSTQDNCTSTPVFNRRRSGGELKKSWRKSNQSPKLFSKSKSEESVEADNKKSHREEPKTDYHSFLRKYGFDKSVTPTKKKETLERTGSSAKSSPRMPRAELLLMTKQTHSAPTTPSLSAKDSFTFPPVHDNTPSFTDHHTAPTFMSAASATSFSESRRTPAHQHSWVSQRSQSPTEESSVNIALLRLIKDLHEEALLKMNIPVTQEIDTDSSGGSSKTKLKSPFELLDEFIECGSSLHSLQLSKIPITSQFDTDWTYFGGSTPADELSILKTQVNLLETQLQYERYKCDQHVLRNRRLVGKVHKAQAIEDELHTLRSQVLLYECELGEAKVASKTKDELIRRLGEICKLQESQKTEALHQYSEENRRLKSRLDEVCDELTSNEQQLILRNKETEEVKHELFETKCELEQIRPKLEINDAVKAKADNLSKELITFQEKYEKIKRQVRDFQTNYIGSEENSMEMESLKNEIREYKTEREHLSTCLDAAKIRIAEFEAILAKKESLIREQKNNAELIHQKHEEEKKIMEERYNSLKKTSQTMESHILYLLAKMEEQGKDTRSLGRSDWRRRSERTARSDRSDHSSHDERSDERCKGDSESHQASRTDNDSRKTNRTDAESHKTNRANVMQRKEDKKSMSQDEPCKHLNRDGKQDQTGRSDKECEQDCDRDCANGNCEQDRDGDCEREQNSRNYSPSTFRGYEGALNFGLSREGNLDSRRTSDAKSVNSHIEDKLVSDSGIESSDVFQ